MTKKIIFWGIKTEPNKGKFQFEEGIGVHKLSTIAREKGFGTIIYQDHQFEANPEKIVDITRAHLDSDSIIAYSLLSDGIPLLKELEKRDIAPEVPVMIGGPGATIEPEKVLGIYGSHQAPVVLVQGDGEIHFRNLLGLVV